MGRDDKSIEYLQRTFLMGACSSDDTREIEILKTLHKNNSTPEY
jgi:hypothetical protein